MISTKIIFKPNIFIYSSFLIISIFVCIFVVKNFIGNVYYLKWMDSPKKDEYSVSLLEEKAVKLIPSEASYFLELGRYYHGKARTNLSDEGLLEMSRLAEKFLAKAILLQPSNSSNLAEYAWIAGNLGDFDRAIKYFETAISLSKTNASIHKKYAKWSLYFAKSVFKVDDLDFLVKMYDNPEQVIPFYEERLIGGVMVKTLINITEREWDEALRLKTPVDRNTNMNLGELYLMILEPDKAIYNYKKAKDLIKQLYCYLVKQDFKNVFSIVKHIIESKNRILWSRWNEIEEFLDKITIVNKDDYKAYYWLGKGYYQHYMFEETIENLRKATVLKPDLIDGYFFLAKSYEATGKTDMAMNEYKKILKLEPDHEEANVLLGKIIKNKL